MSHSTSIVSNNKVDGKHLSLAKQCSMSCWTKCVRLFRQCHEVHIHHFAFKRGGGEKREEKEEEKGRGEQRDEGEVMEKETEF